MNILQQFKNLFTPSAYKNEQEHFNQVYASMHIDGPLIYPGRLLQRAAELYPKRTALICQGKEISFKDLYQQATALSHKLAQMGVTQEDRVGLLFENSIEYYVAYFGIWQLGAVVVPLNTFFAEPELEHVLKDCQPKLIISSDEFKARLEAVKASEIAPVLTAADFPAPHGQERIQIPAIDPDRMAALLYTSGTTGFPKGVMLSSNNILYNVAQIAATADVGEGDRLFGVLPLFHSFAQNICIWASFFLGLTTILVPRIERRWILEGLKHKPTLMIGVPAFYGLLCLMKTAPLEGIRYFISGGDALPDKIRGAFELIYRRKICNGYGLTETSPFVAAHLQDELVPTSTIGKPAVGIELRFLDAEGNDVPKDEIGVLALKGENIMLGYYNAPKITADVLTEDGWFKTGDLADLDEKGRIVLRGRHKDLIISKGLNIYPQEIENVLMSHPLVMRVAVVGKPDDQAGEIPIAFVSLREKNDRIAVELKKLCLENLANYKVPKQFIVLDELPVTATHKVNKPALKRDHF